MATQAEKLANLEIHGASRYHVEIDPESNSAHARILRMVGRNKRVLELGCAGGHMTAVLRDRGCDVTASELDEHAGGRASALCRRVIVGDLDQIELEQELSDDQFDVAIAGDALERLHAPAAV